MKTLILALLLLFFSASRAQEALDVGDKISEDLYRQLLSGNMNEGKTGNSEDKILLLDFWGLKCKSCIEGMPKLADLQQQHNKDLKVILVTRDPSEQVGPFLTKRPFVKQLGLDMINGDTILGRLFPYETTPHAVWIGKDKEVKAITYSTFSNTSTVNELLSKNHLDLPFKFADHIDFKQTVLTPGRINKAGRYAVTVFTEQKIDEIGSRTMFSVSGNNIKLFASNLTLKHLYFAAYIDELKLQLEGEYRHRMLRRAKGISFTDLDPLLTEKIYAYESSIPRKGNDKDINRPLLNKMKRDLDEFTGYKSYVDSIPVKCYVLRSINDSGVTGAKEIIYHKDRKIYYGYSGSTIVSILQKSPLIDKPLFFDGDITKQKNFEMKNEYTSWVEIKRDLKSAGFDLKEEIRSIKMLIIEEKQ